MYWFSGREMAKKSNCCGASIYDARRGGKTYLLCNRCKQETTIQKRVVMRGVWNDPHKGK